MYFLISGPNRKRKSRIIHKNFKKTTLHYLEEKNHEKLKLKMRELDVEENRQKLEKERLEIEKERLVIEKERFYLEKEERKSMLHLLQNHQLLINELVKKNIFNCKTTL